MGENIAGNNSFAKT